MKKLIFALFALTVFLNSFLLFQVQPIFAKTILPWFGGSAAVWTSCMLFFQLLLLAGYGFAHFASSRLSPRAQIVVYLSLVALCLLTLEITPRSAPVVKDGVPLIEIFSLLFRHVGLPYFLLSSATPLLQTWFDKERSSISAYRLYALSNIGSLLALISYPSLLEPSLPLSGQHFLWTISFYALAALFASCALRSYLIHSDEPGDREETSAQIPWRFILLWFSLPACASALLLAITNYVCHDLAVIPFLWIAPLVLYLLSFILTFDSPRWYHRIFFMPLAVVAVAAMYRGYVIASPPSQIEVMFEAFLALFAVSMICHGELVRIKPPSSQLTLFYLLLSAGGAGGGVFVALISPAIFTSYIELPFSLLGAALLCFYMLSTNTKLEFKSPRLGRIFIATGIGALIGTLAILYKGTLPGEGVLYRSRNFYGVMRALEYSKSNPEKTYRTLRHGRTVHGSQFMAKDKQNQPTTYFTEKSGAGRAIRVSQARGKVHIGVIGLGIGVVATYGNVGDRFRFYEINPDVVYAAKEYFSFLGDSKAQIDIILGDARLSLEREKDQNFDVLMIDAFSSDSIPVHLLTKQAMSVYLRHLSSSGLLVFHISNRHLDLRPVVNELAKHHNLHSRTIRTNANPSELVADSTYMVLASNSLFFENDMFSDIPLKDSVPIPKGDLWTDDYSNVFALLRW